jgi:hypothetical protein
VTASFGSGEKSERNVDPNLKSVVAIGLGCSFGVEIDCHCYRGSAEYDELFAA